MLRKICRISSHLVVSRNVHNPIKVFPFWTKRNLVPNYFSLCGGKEAMEVSEREHLAQLCLMSHKDSGGRESLREMNAHLTTRWQSICYLTITQTNTDTHSHTHTLHTHTVISTIRNMHASSQLFYFPLPELQPFLEVEKKRSLYTLHLKKIPWLSPTLLHYLIRPDFDEIKCFPIKPVWRHSRPASRLFPLAPLSLAFGNLISYSHHGLQRLPNECGFARPDQALRREVSQIHKLYMRADLRVLVCVMTLIIWLPKSHSWWS